MDWAPAVLEPVQLSVPLFAPLGTVLEIVKSPLNRKMKTIKNENCQLQQSPQALSNGAHPDATYGGIKDAVTIPSAEKEVPVTEEHVDGLTTSQVHHDDLFSSCELTKKFQERLVPSLAVCPMVPGPVKCRRFPSMAFPSWTKMLSHTRVSLGTFGQQYTAPSSTFFKTL